MPIRPQPISGVSSQHENMIMFVYPSVSATATGRALGRLYESWIAAGLVAALLFAAGAALALHAASEGWLEGAVAWGLLAALGAALLVSAALKRKPGGIKPSHLLFTLLSTPAALLVYVLQKVGGQRYVLTNRHLTVWTMFLGAQRMLRAQVPLAQIDDIAVEQRPGQEFFRAADLIVLDAAGHTLARLDGVPRADVFRQIILEARDARRQVEASLVQIAARASQPVPA